ncbi:hypothetical protein AX769_22520 (plasmid) [Frondihabitans sp. PAMC 28766]|nr:hypothetical protein AX769_22520 [Frondihabitans sp. PAMC 28766]
MSGGVSAVASGAFQDAANNIYQGFDGLMKDFLTSWVGQGLVVNLDGSAAKWFQQSILPINILLLVVGLIIAGVRTMLAANGGPFREALTSLGRVLAVTTFGTAAVQILVWGGDAYAQWILKESGTSADSGKLAGDFASQSPGLALIFGLLGIIAVGLQWAIMFVRQAMLLLLMVFWPTTASYAMMRQGQQAFEKVTAWIIAFVIYSPLAASIYAFAWRLKDGQDGPGGVIYGLMLIALAIIALPAMMRLLVPAAAAMGNASGGAMALGMTAAAVSAGVAVGAAVATGGGSAAAGAGGGTAGTAAKAAGPSAATGGDVASATGGGDEATGGGGNSPVAGGGGEAAAPSGTSAGGGDSSGSGGSAQSASGASDSGSSSGAGGQSTGSKAGWAAGGSAADSASSSDGAAEGMISE